MIDFDDDQAVLTPASIESEQSVLGRLLLDGNALDRISDLLIAESFYDAGHRLVFRAIQGLVAQNKGVDVVTVADRLESTGQIEDAGGMAYLITLAQNTPSAANVRRYAEIVRDRYLRRCVLRKAAELIDAVRSRDGSDADQIITSAAAELDGLTQANAADDRTMSAIDIAQAGINRIDEAFTARMDGRSIGLQTGFRDLDSRLQGLKEGDLVIVAGRPAMGKTAFAMNIADHVGLTQGAVLVFSMEMSPEQLSLRQYASLGSAPLPHLQSGDVADDDWARLTTATAKISEMQLTVDFRAALRPSQMFSKARQIARRSAGGLSLIVVDYLQLMRPDIRAENRNQEITHISGQLKALAKEMRCPVIALSQLSRNVEQRTDKRPMMSDLRESGSIEQDADTILFLYRDEYYNSESTMKGIAEVIVSKLRMGETGKVALSFQGALSRFKDLARDWEMPAENARKAHCSFGGDDL